MRISEKRVIECTLAAMTLMTGLIAAAVVYRVNDQNVHVRLKNMSGQGVSQVRLIHEQGVIVVRDLKQDTSRRVKSPADGEGSFSLDVEFENGNSIQGGGGYVEPGYRMTVSIHRNDLSTRHDYF
ncbi:MAG TPA: hypothetical protein PLZ21_11155 [Armatimonadota bacterium]|nr:hypothetical protein [Armatimonadota bacterium]